MQNSLAIGRALLSVIVVILILLIIAVAAILFPASYIVTSHTRTSISTSFTTITFTNSPASQDCSPSNSQLGSNNLDWTEPFAGANGSDMRLLVLSVNSSATASLCILYTKNPTEASNTTEVDIGAWTYTLRQQQNPGIGGASAPGVSIAVQPNQLNFSNSSNDNQQFFVKITITVAKSSSSGYYLLGATDVCQVAGLAVNQNSSGMTGSAYSNLYEPSCGVYGHPVGRLVGVSGLSYGYANVPM